MYKYEQIVYLKKTCLFSPFIYYISVHFYFYSFLGGLPSKLIFSISVQTHLSWTRLISIVSKPIKLLLKLRFYLHCLDLTLTLPWTLNYLTLALPWPCLDPLLTLPWPCFDLTLIIISNCLNVSLTLLWPFLDLSLTFPWPCSDLVLTFSWPCLNLELTLPWSWLELALTLPWACLDLAFTFPLPCLDLSLTFTWTWIDLDNLPLKFGHNWVSDSWDIADMEKCRQDKCFVNKCHLTVGICSRCFQEPTFKVWSKSGQ